MTSDDRLRVRIVCTVHPNYRVFDLSGTSEFAINYFVALGKNEYISEQGLALKIWTYETLLDLPYALKHGYLEIRDRSLDTTLDFSDLDLHSEPQTQQYVTIPQKKHSGLRAGEGVKFSVPIKPSSQIAAKFVAGGEYRLEITVAGVASSIKWCKFIDGTYDASASSSMSDTNGSDDVNKICWWRQANGRVDFRVLPCVEKPPHIQITLAPLFPLQVADSNSLVFAVEITNHGAQPITVRSRGLHRYLSNLNVHGVLEEDRCEHSRITHLGPVDRRNFSLLKTRTRDQLIPHQEPICGSPLSTHRDCFTTLPSLVPVKKQVCLRKLVPWVDFEVGEEYELSIPPLSVEWFWGTIEEALGLDERLAKGFS